MSFISMRGSSRVRGEERARLRELGPCGSLTGHRHELREVALRLRRVAALRGCLRGAVVAAEALGLAELRRFELLERVGGTLELEQHLSEQLACGRDARRSHDVLLALIFHVC